MRSFAVFFAWASLLFAFSNANAEVQRELKVHLAQANNESPYAFVRAKFEPGELLDPWSVRFLDDKGVEVPYFVWDTIDWRTAGKGRADWGHRYALVNHGPGDELSAVLARETKLAWAERNRPVIGAKLAAQDKAASENPDSVCTAIYLVRKRVPALGKQKLALQIHRDQQAKVQRQEWKGDEVRDRVTVTQGDLTFRGLPDELEIAWKGQPVVKTAGFDAGGTTGATSHVDSARPFTMQATMGIVTKLVVIGQTKWRSAGVMDWQCTYWLFPEGSYVALEGFSLGQASQYRGGPQKLSVFVPPDEKSEFKQLHPPTWDQPWWLHATNERGFAATHLLSAVSLAVGYGNNPFSVNAEGPNKDPRVDLEGRQLSLRWFHEVNDPAISRLMGAPLVINGRSTATGAAATEQPAEMEWKPKVDWLYRQYFVGVGEEPETAENSLRNVLGAAAGWLDRPFDEEEIATRLVGMVDDIGRNGQSAEIGLLKVIPAVLNEDVTAVQTAMRDRLQDHPTRTDFYIDLMRRSVAAGLRPAGGGKQLPDGSRQEGWTGNPCYHATLMPCYTRTLEHFDLPHSREEYRDAILRYADFGLELLGGTPFDIEKFRTTLEAEWPSRVVPTIPLMLHAYSLKPDEKYAQVAKLLFDDLYRLVERNPHGYFPAWTWQPQADRYDTVYNPVSYERGLTAFWSEDQLKLIGREKAEQFAAAQARYFVFSGQLLDSLETDNPTAIRACTHGGHTSLRNQIGLYLYDDFDFYRGLLGDLVIWSAATPPPPSRQLATGTAPYRRLELSNAGSSMVRWALGIRPGSKATETKVHPAAKGEAFQLEVWHRLPRSPGVAAVSAKDVGIKGDGEALRLELAGPVYRRPAQFEVRRRGNSVVIKVTQSADVRLAYSLLLPKVTADTKLILLRRGSGNTTTPVADVKQNEGTIEWAATPGEYELRGS